MFFRKIEMTGFKSFANRTEVVFKPGVTVIVGPNGCGKSNIFDAIRWVLGEQSAKSLRGQRMGDVIFAGSDTHRATAFAQVALTVSNEDRRLPIDFNEVVIARRLMRTGESEYLINRHSCRLRDIVELFMDTGVGTNAYSVMEQGRIDQIINARPVDRREIFEEAAGVSKYRARRAETQRRLGRTDDDLIRLVDIIAEVKRQATSLKRQANRAERYKRLAEELREIEMRLLAHRWRNHHEEGRDLVEEVAAVENRLAEVSAKLAQLDAEHEQRMSETERLNRQVHNLSTAINAKTQEIHDAEHRTGLLRQRSEINTTRAAELDGEMRGARERLTVAEADLERLGQRRAEHETSFTERERVHVARREECDRVRAGFDQHERALGELRSHLADLRTRQVTLDNEIRLAAIMGEKLGEEIKVIEAQREEESTRLDEANRVLTEREEVHRTEAARLGEMTERSEGLDARLGDLADEESEVNEAVGVCQSDLSETQSRLRALRALQESFEGYREGVRQLMQAKESGEIRGVLGTLASLIHPARDHEIALEAALGGDEQIVIARRAKHRKAALAWLQASGQGRATVLALDCAREPRRTDAELLERDEVITWADTVVECEDEVRPAVRDLLGETLIVRDLQTALRLSADGTAQRCVTPAGEVAVGGARVTAGKIQASGLLSRERDITDADERAKRLDQELGDLQRRHSTLEESRRQTEAEHRDATAARQRQEIHLAELAKDFEMAQRETQTARETVERLAARCRELQEQIEQQLDTRASAAERLDEARAEISQLEESQRTTEGESESSGAEARRLSEEVQALAIEVARAREQLETLRLRHESAQSECAELSERIAAAEVERTRLLGENEEAATEITALDERLGTLVDERRTLETQVSEQRGESDRAGVDLKQLSQEIHTVTRERNELQNRFHELKVSESQHEMHLQRCDEEAQEKYQTSMADILSAHPDPIEDIEGERSQAAEIRQRMDAMGPVNVIAIDEYQQLSERREFLQGQESDLLEAKKDLEETIAELDKTTMRLFTKSFEEIRQSFQMMFRRLFGGGRADLVALDPENLLESGIEIIAQPPGKKLQAISLLSGGEKALTAISLLFGIFQQRPSPFCVLDEIDAPLDDKNISRFKELLVEFSQTTQFIIITHNKLTMQLADTLFGITMEDAGVSRLVGVNIQTAQQYAA